MWRTEAKGAGGVTGVDQSELLLNAAVSESTVNSVVGDVEKKQMLCGFNSVDAVFPVTLIIRLCKFGSSK